MHPVADTRPPGAVTEWIAYTSSVTERSGELLTHGRLGDRTPSRARTRHVTDKGVG